MSTHETWVVTKQTNIYDYPNPVIIAAFDFATVSDCDQQVVGPTNACGGTLSLDLLMTDVPDLVGVPVGAFIDNSDHSSLSAVISMAQAVPNLLGSR